MKHIQNFPIMMGMLFPLAERKSPSSWVDVTVAAAVIAFVVYLNWGTKKK